MIIKRISLENFRSHIKYELVMKNMTSLIVGENGSGKTSVLEAIYLALRGKSFKANDKEILRRGAEFYRIELEFMNNKKTIVGYDGKKKFFLTDDKKTLRLAKDKKEPVILFEPRDLNLISASPSRRRDYFDEVLSQINMDYSSLKSRYEKALKQRNELLKNNNLKKIDLFSWNMMLVKYGVEINKRRKLLIEEINNKLTEIYRTIADNQDEINIRYKTEVEEGGKYLKYLEQNFEKDIWLGYTSFGIHRDDYEFLFNQVLADGSASRGEIRSIILALKFIEANLIKKANLKDPLILLDDVFSELDDKRQQALVSNFKNHQVILTSVEEINRW